MKAVYTQAAAVFVLVLHILLIFSLGVNVNALLSSSFGRPPMLRVSSTRLLSETTTTTTITHELDIADTALPWSKLSSKLLDTPTGERLTYESEQQEKGLGDEIPHIDATLRLFDASVKEGEEKVRVTLYRDAAAWCPYSQRVWILLEEKRISYRVQKVPLNAYGDKPAWFTRIVDEGKLPAVELDGKLHTESLEIMKLLDATFIENGPRMVPEPSTPKAELYDNLMYLEKELQRDWFSFVFYPVQGVNLERARDNFLATLRKVDDALGYTPGPWLLGDDAPSLVDLQYISHVERIVASVLYWRGLQLRGGTSSNNFRNLDGWLAAFEERPSYIATKSDYYTLVMAMPSQNGPGCLSETARPIADRICGLSGAWDISRLDEVDNLEPPIASQTIGGVEAARHEAAYTIISNHANIVQFAARGAGEVGRPSYHAELADPYAEPNEEIVHSVDVCLRHVTGALIDGVEHHRVAAESDLAGRAGDGELREEWDQYEDESGNTYYWHSITGDATWTAPTRQLDTCLAYLRDRVGVPRDMRQAAAFQLRAHLNWAIAILNLGR